MAMGTPSSQQDQRTAHDVLRDVLRGSSHTVDEQDLRSTGVDVDMVEAMYETNVRPYLDYLHGYRGLDELDPLGNDRPREYDTTRREWLPKESWEELLGRFGQLGQHRQVLQVTGGRLYRYDRKWSGPENLWINIYLTRKGTWLFWYIEKSRQNTLGNPYTNECITAHQSVRELWEAAHVLVPDGFKFEFRGGYNVPGYIPLDIERGLRRILEVTITERAKRLESMKSALEDANRRISIITYKR